MRVLPNDRPHHVVLGLEHQDLLLIQLLQLTLGPPRHIRNALELALLSILGMEMDSHGGLEVTIRQTESKKKNYPTTS